ncbi:MAG: hypothetical protein AAF763_05860 [Pseudomonadota bacterium]
MTLPLADRAIEEAHDLHRFLQAWLTGDWPRDGFARFADAMAPELQVISPLGATTEREALLTEFESLHGELAAKKDAFEIWVERAVCRHVLGDVAVVTYEEWHKLEGETSARLSTVLYRDAPEAPGGVSWLHVHETWLPGQAPEAGERFPEKA